MVPGRPAVMGRNGVVASAHPLASMAGLRVLMAGGNAVDAAVAVAATLNVVEPYMSGLGGDGYMLITPAGASRPVVLDYSGPVPREARAADYTRDDQVTGPKSPLVPGAPGGWLAALERFGTMSPGPVFADAIMYAERGAPISFKNTEFIAGAQERIARFPLTAENFLPGGAPPRPGSTLRQPRLAQTYRTLAEQGTEAFYQGEIGAEIVRSVRAAGGVLSEGDLAEFRVEWQEPISTTFQGYEIFGPQPPSAAIEYLELLRIVEDEDLAGLGHNSADYLHLLIEVVKLASADRIAYTMPAAAGSFDARALLDPAYIAEQRGRLNRQRAAVGRGDHYGPVEAAAIRAGTPAKAMREHTTHFGVADASGMAVNVTQSIGAPFGSGFMAGETGIMLNNFVAWTDLDQASPNAMAPRKKMENCMSPAQIFRDGRFYATIGTPGSWGILQTTPQMMLNLLVHGMNIQEAVEAPRFRFSGGRTVTIERRVPRDVLDALKARGHEIEELPELSWAVGGGHGTLRDPESGVLMGGADPRRDGYAVAW